MFVPSLSWQKHRFYHRCCVQHKLHTKKWIPHLEVVWALLWQQHDTAAAADTRRAVGSGPTVLHRRVEQTGRCRSDVIADIDPAKIAFFFECFPMFVPSLSWYNDRFDLKTAPKKPFLFPHHFASVALSTPLIFAVSTRCSNRNLTNVTAIAGFWSVTPPRSPLQPYQKTRLFFEFPLCLSRACLRKVIIFTIRCVCS
jgi:hypothetical protein